MLKMSLHSRIVGLILAFLCIGVFLSIYWNIKSKRHELLGEKVKASRLMAEPILNSIYVDMLDEKPDLVRYFIDALRTVEGTERIQIIRSNGIEEAFQDLKTIEAVRKVVGYTKTEWLENHPNKKHNIAEGVQNEEFKRAFEQLKENWDRGAIYYIEKTGDRPIFTYLQPIEKRQGCDRCHTGEGARGILMISLSLEDMYLSLAKTRNQWIIIGFLAVTVGGMLLSFVIKRSITEPIEKTVNVLKRISENLESSNGITEKINVASDDEIGYLARTFNNMLEALRKRDDEKRRLLETVIKSREEWVATFDAIQDLISIHDRDSRIVKVNRAFARKFNAEPEDLLGRKCYELLYYNAGYDTRCPHLRTLETGRIESVEVDDMVFNGIYQVITYPIFSNTGEVWAVVHIARDITKEKTLQEQLLHSEKLSSIGKLVAGIAHELNNPLMGIMGYSQLLIDMPGDKSLEEIKEKLQKIYHESIRTAKIVQNLLTFARSRKAEKNYHDINTILKQTLELKEYSLKTNNIEVVLDLEPNLPKTMVDFYQLEQVFINIINNAADAIVAYRERGRLEIRTSLEDDMIKITFRDDGPGIPNDIIHKVFDPFFTTKEVGKGTGLGLSITHGIITEHGGTINITSPQEGGSLVTITLPVIQKTESTDGVSLNSMVNREVYNGDTLLVVDDEKAIRESLSDILTREGFKVEMARDGKEALDALERQRFSLIVADVKMPGVGGKELYEIISKKYAYMKNRIILLTGDVFSNDVREFFKTSGCPYILKPFEPRELIKMVKEIISSRAGEDNPPG